MSLESDLAAHADLLAATMAELTRIATPIAPVLYKVPEAAQALRVDRSIVYDLIRAGHLATATLPTMSEVRIPAAALAELVERSTSTAPHLQAVGE